MTRNITTQRNNESFFCCCFWCFSINCSWTMTKWHSNGATHPLPLLFKSSRSSSSFLDFFEPHADQALFGGGGGSARELCMGLQICFFFVFSEIRSAARSRRRETFIVWGSIGNISILAQLCIETEQLKLKRASFMLNEVINQWNYAYRSILRR